MSWPDDLFDKYPLTFAKTQDFCCGEGWRGLLTDLCDTLEPLLESFPEDERPYAVQVKEKFGGLRFYMMGSSLEMEAAIDIAEERALKTCEVCGAPGQPNESGWISVRCIPCRTKQQTP